MSSSLLIPRVGLASRNFPSWLSTGNALITLTTSASRNTFKATAILMSIETNENVVNASNIFKQISASELLWRLLIFIKSIQNSTKLVDTKSSPGLVRKLTIWIHWVVKFHICATYFDWEIVTSNSVFEIDQIITLLLEKCSRPAHLFSDFHNLSWVSKNSVRFKKLVFDEFRNSTTTDSNRTDDSKVLFLILSNLFLR